MLPLRLYSLVLLTLFLILQPTSKHGHLVDHLSLLLNLVLVKMRLRQTFDVG